MQLSNVKYFYDEERTNPQYGINGYIGDVQFSLIAGSMNNLYYAEIMRQVEAGELTIQDAD